MKRNKDGWFEADDPRELNRATSCNEAELERRRALCHPDVCPHVDARRGVKAFVDLGRVCGRCLLPVSHGVGDRVLLGPLNRGGVPWIASAEVVGTLQSGPTPAPFAATPEALQNDFDVFKVMACAAIVHALADQGVLSGSIPCPICKTGRLSWSIAMNSHARGVCDRVVGKNAEGFDVHCVAFVE